MKTHIFVIIALVIFAPILVLSIFSCNLNKKNSQTIKSLITQDSTKTVPMPQIKQIIYTKSSWYGDAFHGRTMANGDIFNMYDPTIVAHKTLPFGTRLKIQNLDNGKSVECVVQDRGPYIEGRGIDLSYAAAKIIGIDKSGVSNVRIEVFPKG